MEHVVEAAAALRRHLDHERLVVVGTPTPSVEVVMPCARASLARVPISLEIRLALVGLAVAESSTRLVSCRRCPAAASPASSPPHRAVLPPADDPRKRPLRGLAQAVIHGRGRQTASARCWRR